MVCMVSVFCMLLHHAMHNGVDPKSAWAEFCMSPNLRQKTEIHRWSQKRLAVSAIMVILGW